MILLYLTLAVTSPFLVVSLCASWVLFAVCTPLACFGLTMRVFQRVCFKAFKWLQRSWWPSSIAKTVSPNISPPTNHGPDQYILSQHRRRLAMDSVARRDSMLEADLLQTTPPPTIDPPSDEDTSEFVELNTELFTDLSESSESSESVETMPEPGTMTRTTVASSAAATISSSPPLLRYRKQHASSESIDDELYVSQLGTFNTIQTQSNIEARGVKMRPARLENAEQVSSSYPLLKERTEVEEDHGCENVEDVKKTRAISSDTVEAEDSVRSSVASADEAPSVEASVGSLQAFTGRSRSWVSDDAHGE
ncbi:hypothetical protein BJ741DRAFT_597182 [Chytriomyces cf. hyalinus JEL632]|nr:hypothetical protein BJ741DRAFT_597182 [Chytriomyces cf. hyalinus JEL632]